MFYSELRTQKCIQYNKYGNYSNYIVRTVFINVRIYCFKIVFNLLSWRLYNGYSTVSSLLQKIDDKFSSAFMKLKSEFQMYEN